MLNDREIATLAWLGIGFLVVMLVPRLRRWFLSCARDLLRILFGSPTVPAIFGLFILWCAVWVLLAASPGYWTLAQLKDSILILLFVGFPVLFNAVRADSGTAIVRRIAREAVVLTALLAFIVSAQPFPWWAEFFLVLPGLTFLSVMAAWANTRDQAKPVRGCLNVVLGLAGIAVLLWAVAQLIFNSATRNWLEFARDFALSIWLPIVMIPFFYCAAFFGAVEGIVKDLRRRSPPVTRRVAFAAVLGLQFRLRWARKFTFLAQRDVAQAVGFRDALRRMRDFRAGVEAREETLRERADELAALAGVVEVDGTGAYVDRREFDASKNALSLIHLNQTAHRERTGRYWDDLTDLIVGPPSRFGLPVDHGVVVEVGPRGKSWRAWRTTVGNWTLGIGGASGLPDRFYYAQNEAPTTWPGTEPWVNGSAGSPPPDWTRDDDPKR